MGGEEVVLLGNAADVGVDAVLHGVAIDASVEEEEGAVATSAASVDEEEGVLLGQVAEADVDVGVDVDVDVLSPVHRVASVDEAAVATLTSHTAAATHKGKGF